MIHLDSMNTALQFLLIPFIKEIKESRAPASIFPPSFLWTRNCICLGLNIDLLDIDSTAMLNIPSSFVRYDHMCRWDICGRICLFFLVGRSLHCFRLCGTIHTTQIPGILRSKSKQHLDLVSHHFSIFDLTFATCFCWDSNFLVTASDRKVSANIGFQQFDKSHGDYCSF